MASLVASSDHRTPSVLISIKHIGHVGHADNVDHVDLVNPVDHVVDPCPAIRLVAIRTMPESRLRA
ncbi:hypothetical protein BDW66DRAFT_146301 [Aspergillus desertorum]